MTPVRSSGSTFPVAGCDCSRFAMTSEASASLVVAKRRPGRGSSLRSGPARIQQCKTALCLDGGRVWDAVFIPVGRRVANTKLIRPAPPRNKCTLPLQPAEPRGKQCRTGGWSLTKPSGTECPVVPSGPALSAQSCPVPAGRSALSRTQCPVRGHVTKRGRKIGQNRR